MKGGRTIIKKKKNIKNKNIKNKNKNIKNKNKKKKNKDKDKDKDKLFYEANASRRKNRWTEEHRCHKKQSWAQE